MANASVKTVHIIGLGAVGATYGSLMYHHDKESVKVVLDSERVSRYQDGVIINGKRYDFHLTVPKPGDPEAEFILIAVKGHQLEEAIELMAPIVGKDTIILSLLNGITSEEDLSRRFGRDKVLHGFCVGTDAVRVNREVVFTNTGRIVLGEYYPEVRGKAAAVAEFLARAGVPHTVPEDIRREMWWKFMMNVGVNQTSAILGAPYGIYNSIPEARELMFSACREVLPLAEKEGVSLYESDIDEFIRIFSTLSPQGKTSMLQDVEAGRKTEVESFSLAVMNLGKKHGIPTPVNEMLYNMIRVIELSRNVRY